MFWYWAYLMKVAPETRHAHYILYLRFYYARCVTSRIYIVEYYINPWLLVQIIYSISYGKELYTQKNIYIIKQVGAEELTTAQMIQLGTNSPP
jgi:hypothetical protein